MTPTAPELTCTASTGPMSVTTSDSTWGRREVSAAPIDAASKYHLLLNLAVGGDWAGKVNATGIDAAVFPQAMLVDYVRVYRCNAGRPDGSGCATLGADAKQVVPEPAQRRPATDAVAH